MRNLTIGQKVGYAPCPGEVYKVKAIRRGNKYGRNVEIEGDFSGGYQYPQSDWVRRDNLLPIGQGVAVMRNELSRKESDAIIDSMIDRGGPFMTLADTLAHAKSYQ